MFTSCLRTDSSLRYFFGFVKYIIPKKTKNLAEFVICDWLICNSSCIPNSFARKLNKKTVRPQARCRSRKQFHWTRSAKKKRLSQFPCADLERCGAGEDAPDTAGLEASATKPALQELGEF